MKKNEYLELVYNQLQDDVFKILKGKNKKINIQKHFPILNKMAEISKIIKLLDN